MKIIGIIVEYNPFHYGHLYHLQAIKKMYPDSLVITVMSGNFTQRGEPSIINKWDKTDIALQAGIDLVVELPFVYATQSADIFAKGAIEILRNMQVDILVFGSETNNIEELKIKAKEIMAYEKNFKTFNKRDSYAKILGDVSDVKLPNDILGVCYIKEIIKQKASIEPISIKRTNDFNSDKLKSSIVSASAIRKALKEKKDVNEYVPSYTIPFLRKKKLFIDDYFSILKYKILTEDLSKYSTVESDMNYRLKKYITNIKDIDELINKTITKRYTKTKMQRMFTHIICHLTKEEVKNNKQKYIRILGMSNTGQKYLKDMKKISKIDIITKFVRRFKNLDIELRATKVYAYLTKKDKLIKEEYQNKIIIR